MEESLCLCVCMCVCVCVCVCPAGSRRCQTEEVSDGGGAEEVSDEEVSLMERGALYSADLWEKCVRCRVEEEEEEEELEKGTR